MSALANQFFHWHTNGICYFRFLQGVLGWALAEVDEICVSEIENPLSDVTNTVLAEMAWELGQGAG